jgi:hypothetical protein
VRWIEHELEPGIPAEIAQEVQQGNGGFESVDLLCEGEQIRAELAQLGADPLLAPLDRKSVV